MVFLEFEAVPADQRGHRFNREGVFMGSISTVEDDEPLWQGFPSVHNGFSCSYCDAYPGFTAVEDGDQPLGFSLRAKTSCPLGTPLIPVVTRLGVTSGRVIFADSLDRHLDIELDYSVSISSAAGQALHALKWTEVGAVGGFINEFGVSLVSLGGPQKGGVDGGVYQLAHLDMEEESETPKPRALLGHVDGPVHSYMLMDLERWHELCGQRDQDGQAILEEEGWDVVDLPAGSYVLTHYTDPLNERFPIFPEVFASLVRV